MGTPILTGNLKHFEKALKGSIDFHIKHVGMHTRKISLTKHLCPHILNILTVNF